MPSRHMDELFRACGVLLTKERCGMASSGGSVCFLLGPAVYGV